MSGTSDCSTSYPAPPSSLGGLPSHWGRPSRLSSWAQHPWLQQVRFMASAGNGAGSSRPGGRDGRKDKARRRLPDYLQHDQLVGRGAYAWPAAQHPAGQVAAAAPAGAPQAPAAAAPVAGTPPSATHTGVLRHLPWQSSYYHPDRIAQRMRSAKYILGPVVVLGGAYALATVPAHHIITQNNISNSSDFAVQISCRRLRMFMEGSYIMPFGHWPFGMDKAYVASMLENQLPEKLVARTNHGAAPATLKELLLTLQAMLNYPEAKDALARAGAAQVLRTSLQQGWLPKPLHHMAADVIVGLRQEREQQPYRQAAQQRQEQQQQQQQQQPSDPEEVQGRKGRRWW